MSVAAIRGDPITTVRYSALQQQKGGGGFGVQKPEDILRR